MILSVSAEEAPLENTVDQSTEYEFEPFERIFLSRRDEIIRLVDVSSFALRNMSGAARLSEVLKHDENRVERMRELESLAMEEVNSDFPILHNAASVLLWGALEASVRDFLVRWLWRNPSALQIQEFQNVRVRVAEYESLDGENRMRYLVSILERELSASLKPGVGRFDCLLKPFGINPKITEELRRDMNEIAAIRNVIVHRAGLADARLLELCPWLGLKREEFVKVPRASLIRYVGAASNYAAEIIVSARNILDTSSQESS